MKPQDPHSRTALAAGAAAFLAAFLGSACVTAAPPIDPSELVAPRVVLVDGDVEFTIEPTVSGRRYQLQQSDTMDVGTWLDVGAVRTGDGTALVMTIPREPLAPRRFYRVALDPVPAAPDGFVLIPGGGFLMGDESATPVNVHVSDFYMATHEVTKALWDEVRAWGLDNDYTDIAAGGGKGANHPVHSINWHDIVKWSNARSEMEGLTPCYTVAGEICKTGTSNDVVCNWSANGYRIPSGPRLGAIVRHEARQEVEWMMR